jgi:hypothetical protein
MGTKDGRGASPVRGGRWRFRSRSRSRSRAGAIVDAVRIEPLSGRVAKLAGEALASVRGSAAVDAIVMASAAQRGDIVYTSDVDDLQKLAGHFRGVRVLGIRGGRAHRGIPD